MPDNTNDLSVAAVCAGLTDDWNVQATNDHYGAYVTTDTRTALVTDLGANFPHRNMRYVTQCWARKPVGYAGPHHDACFDNLADAVNYAAEWCGVAPAAPTQGDLDAARHATDLIQFKYLTHPHTWPGHLIDARNNVTHARALDQYEAQALAADYAILSSYYGVMWAWSRGYAVNRHAVVDALNTVFHVAATTIGDAGSPTFLREIDALITFAQGAPAV